MIPLSWSWYLICSFLDYVIPFRCFYLDAKKSDVSELSQMWLFSETALKNEVAESYIIQQLHSLALFQKTVIAVHPWWTPELQPGKWHEKKIRRKQKKHVLVMNRLSSTISSEIVNKVHKTAFQQKYKNATSVLIDYLCRSENQIKNHQESQTQKILEDAQKYICDVQKCLNIKLFLNGTAWRNVPGTFFK